MDRTRHKVLNEKLIEITKDIDRFYAKRDITSGDSHLLGITVEKPNELLVLERRQRQIFDAIDDNVSREPNMDNWKNPGQVLMDAVMENLL